MKIKNIINKWTLTMLSTAMILGGCSKSEFEDVSLDLSKDVKIETFEVPGALEVVVNESAKLINITFPGGADVSAISPAVTVSSGADVSPASGSPVNLKVPQFYTVKNGNLYSTYEIKTVVLSVTAFLSHHTSVNDITDDDEKAYAEWFFAKYASNVAEFVSFQDIKDGDVDLSKYKVITWYHDQAFPLPAISTDADVLNAVSEWYKAGGNLYLLGYANQYLFELDRITNDYYMGIGQGAGGENPDTWGIGVNIRGKDQSGHPLFAGISLTTHGDGRKTFPAITPGWKEDHNYVIVRIPEFYGLANDNVVAYDKFTADNTAKWLGMWDGIGDYFMAGIIEFLPNDTFEGRAIFQGIGGLEWKQNPQGTINPTGTNAHRVNIEKLAENAISYLSLN